jgi:hypothetical protein
MIGGIASDASVLPVTAVGGGWDVAELPTP